MERNFMNTENFKYVIGQARENEVATIRFFGRITEDSTKQFNAEFDYLESVVRPKLIRVLINSEGGSVLHGMTTYSTIQNSKIETECIIEGMAASMGSIIWAAGNRSLMRDYAILMIHNPFLPNDNESCREPSDMVKAFTKQIETIYRKRFGLTADHVIAIMSGQADKDGTFFDATSAVKAGIIPTENILNTSKQLRDKVKGQLSGIDDATAIEKMMEQITASLSIDLDTIKSLASLEARFKESEKLLIEAQLALKSKDTIIAELQSELSTATTMVYVYQKKEEMENANRTQAEKDALAEQLQKIIGENFQFLSLK